MAGEWVSSEEKIVATQGGSFPWGLWGPHHVRHLSLPIRIQLRTHLHAAHLGFSDALESLCCHPQDGTPGHCSFVFFLPVALSVQGGALSSGDLPSFSPSSPPFFVLLPLPSSFLAVLSSLSLSCSLVYAGRRVRSVMEFSRTGSRCPAAQRHQPFPGESQARPWPRTEHGCEAEGQRQCGPNGRVAPPSRTGQIQGPLEERTCGSAVASAALLLGAPPPPCLPVRLLPRHCSHFNQQPQIH